ncbi:MAG: gliding motility-associated C-terminal domain-containing protein [Flavipsychrobacter sp.]
MKRKYQLFILPVILLLGLPKSAHATGTAGAEIIYQWLHDSTYRFYCVVYEDCTGIPHADSVVMCYSNSCGKADTSVYMPLSTIALPGGGINGDTLIPACPGHPSTCNGGTLPGFRKWWYTRDITLNGRCDHWKFSFASRVRLRARNLRPYYTYGIIDDSTYVETTLDNLDAQGNSSVYFSNYEMPYMCIGNPYTFNCGAIDIDNDSLYYEYIQPLIGYSCDGRNEAYSAGYYLPSNPLASGGTFRFDNSTGTESFTPDSIGWFAQLLRINEYRKYQTSTGYIWKKIGSTMRESDVCVLDCNQPPPTLTVDSNSLTNATDISGEIIACTLTPFNFCFNAKTTSIVGHLNVTDNGNIFPTTTQPSVTYTNMYTDSVRGCVSWTPGPLDTGLHLLIVNITDTEQCRYASAGLPVVYATYAIPIYIWPTTKIFKDTLICPGDTVQLRAVGGHGFSWAAVPGGSGPTSLSCSGCPSPYVYPSLTTQYAVYAASNVRCANRDTITISTLPKPDNKHIDTALCTGSITLSIPVASVGPGISKAIRWSPALYLSSITSANPVYTPGVSERYIVSITYAGKSRCKTVDTVDVKVLKMFDLSFRDTTVCSGVSLQVKASGDTDFDYTWTPAVGVSNPNILTPIITADTTITYTLTSKHINCPDSSASFTITVEPNPIVNAGNDTTVCQGVRFTLNASASPSYPYVYNWSPAYVVDGSSALNPIFISDSSIRLTLTASTAAGCTGSDDVWIKVNPAPYFSLGKDTLVCHINQLQIGDRNNQRSDIRYSWNTGDTSCCITVGNNGVYVLSETDSIRCSYTDSLGVYFSNCLHCISVPNAFSPNNDGINDEFKPVLMCPLKKYDLKIFNRWGQEVFHSQDVNYGWDGKYKGELMGGLVDKSVFVYIIELTEDSSGTEKTLLKGNITVIR